MAHEKERKLLFDYRDFINDLYNGRWLTEAEKHTYLEHVEKFLSTLPDEKDKCCEECEYSSNAIYSLPCTECDENHSKFTTLPEEKEESIISKLDEWISDCEKQSNDFFKRGMTHSEMGSMAMAQAYKNVKELFNPSK